MINKETRVSYDIRLKGEAENSRKVVGYAAMFDKDSENLGGFIERIAPNAFDDALDVSDVRALFNHDDNYVLARTSSGTLNLVVDNNGLRYEFEAPKTTYGDNLLEMLRRGDISQSSFGFTIQEDEWEKRADGVALRTIKKVKRLYDVSPVTYPAYPDTTVAVRKLDGMKPNAQLIHDANLNDDNDFGLNIFEYRLRLSNIEL